MASAVDEHRAFFEKFNKKTIDCAGKQEVSESRCRSAPGGSQSCKTKGNTTFTVYRAGTEDSPSFPSKERDEVWLVTNPAFYYPLGKNEMVHLWKADVQNTPNILAERHLKYEGVCLVKLTKNAKDTYQLLHQNLKSKTAWERLSEVPSSDGGGMSVISFATLVQAIIDYMRDNRPSSPADFNFQAELKAASHWRWLEETVPQFEPGPHDDTRIVKAAKISLRKWINDVNKIEKKLLEEGLSPTIVEKYKSDLEVLEEDIFKLTMYDDIYKKKVTPQKGKIPRQWQHGEQVLT